MIFLTKSTSNCRKNKEEPDRNQCLRRIDDGLNALGVRSCMSQDVPAKIVPSTIMMITKGIPKIT